MTPWNPNHYRFPRTSNHNDPRWLDNDLYDEPASNRGDRMTFVVAVLLLILLAAGVL